MSVSTAELLKNIQIAIYMGKFIEDNKDEFLNERPHDYLNRLMHEKKLELSAVCARSELDGSYCYRILSGMRTPSRNSLIHIVLGMGLCVDEAQQALRLYQFARLDPRCYRDAAILFAISKGYTLMQAAELLYELGEAEL